MLLSAFLVVERVLGSLIPAISLWYTGRVLRLVETAMETHTVDTTLLVDAAVGHLGCTIVMLLLKYARRCILHPMGISVRRFYDERRFHSTVCLDVPANDERCLTGTPVVFSSSDLGMHCEIVEMLTNIAMTVIRLVSQLVVLVTNLQEQQDVWVATTTNEDFLRMKTLEKVAFHAPYRKELVAGNISEYIAAQFCEFSQRIGDGAVQFPYLRRILSIKDSLSVVSILRETVHALPQILFTLRVMQNQ
ncbi:hypothetical protein DFJ58DRAFT_730940 [Suillus subalutaceus]|uniref:uncharacterized protein n=1 Tax=Suillus subalutaceus TaxID=48586 RepID=UPI001B85F8F2|nr:uncharacterized protein DFJ58DRAFT_730940 [Suillus subalutaceus]KAG1845089.1 hypothetical protein DFJ58DRAFT_730940 [Suillus subalutaceus]